MSKGHLEEELVNAHQEVRMEKETEDRDLGIPGLYGVSRASEGMWYKCPNEVYGINQGKELSWRKKKS